MIDKPFTLEERDAYLRDACYRKAHGGQKNRKWTETELSVRREAIYYEMGQGKSYSKMVYDLQQRWGASERTIRSYIKDAKEQLVLYNEESKEHFRNKMIEKLERLADDALANNDRKSALAAYDQISKLNGAYVQKVEADVKEETTISFKFGNE